MGSKTFKEMRNEHKWPTLCFYVRPAPHLRFRCANISPALVCWPVKWHWKIAEKALRVVYGPEIKYEEALAVANITSLQERRETLTMNFAVSTEKNPRYQDGWFPKKTNQAYPIRKPRPYMETKPSTERMKKNPINYMRKMLYDAYVSWWVFNIYTSISANKTYQKYCYLCTNY